MSVDIRPDGSFEVTYVGPYGGLNVQMPENLIKDSESPALNDVILRNDELRSRPLFNATFITAPEAGQAIQGIGNFQGQPWALMADGKFYTFTFAGGAWALQGTTTGTIAPNAMAIGRVFQNKLYVVNASKQMMSWDGSAFTASVASAGGTSIGSVFLDELDNHLLLGVTVEGATRFAQRIRWSASGLPAVWDPSVNINAGLNDFLEVPDNITGLMMLGRVGYILRTDGITEVSPTGRGQAPFDFNHLWASQFGIGNTKFYASAQYGTTGVIVGRDNIYSIQAFQIQPIGGGARDAILADIGVGNFKSGPIAGINQLITSIIVPYFKSDVIPEGASSPGAISLSTGGTGTLPYLAYMLFVPKISQADGITVLGTNIWVYSFEDQSWTKWVLPGFNISGTPSLLYGSDINPPANIPIGPQVTLPVVNNAGVSFLGIFNVNNFNDTAQGSSYSYKVEDIFANRVPTIRRIALTYRDLGVATITLTLTGTDDNQTVQTASTTVTIGNSVPTNVLMVKLVDLGLTAFRPQLSWSRAANGGPVSIARATMIGQVEREVTL